MIPFLKVMKLTRLTRKHMSLAMPRDLHASRSVLSLLLVLSEKGSVCNPGLHVQTYTFNYWFFTHKEMNIITSHCADGLCMCSLHIFICTVFSCSYGIGELVKSGVNQE